MRWDIEASICAIASGTTGAPRGLVRLCGPQCLEILNQLHQYSFFEWNQPDDGPFEKSRKARQIPAWWNLRPGIRLPCDLWVWPTTSSFVGQPTIEFHCVGALPILGQLTQLLCHFGARLAEPGEFSFRSFLAGRMDLAQCEGLLGVIHAENEQSLQIALRQLAGGIGAELQIARQDLIDLTADIEAGLDFVDEDIQFVSDEAIQERIAASIRAVDELKRQIAERRCDAVVRTVALVGLPNAGKSSLMNQLVGRPLAIVSPQAGTTRDFLQCRLPLTQLDLVDTAGQEEVAEHTPRGRAQIYSREQIESAALRLHCIDLTLAPQEITRQLDERDQNAVYHPTWIVGTKCDLASPTSLAVWQRSTQMPGDCKYFTTSSRTGEGIESLKSNLRQFEQESRQEIASLLPMTADRCSHALLSARDSLKMAWTLACSRSSHEVIAAELRLAMDQLGVIAGDVYNDDVLDAIFSRFCIGK